MAKSSKLGGQNRITAPHPKKIGVDLMLGAVRKFKPFDGRKAWVEIREGRRRNQ